MYKVGNVVSFGGVEKLVGFFGSVFGLIFFFFCFCDRLCVLKIKLK